MIAYLASHGVNVCGVLASLARSRVYVRLPVLGEIGSSRLPLAFPTADRRGNYHYMRDSRVKNGVGVTCRLCAYIWVYVRHRARSPRRISRADAVRVRPTTTAAA